MVRLAAVHTALSLEYIAPALRVSYPVPGLFLICIDPSLGIMICDATLHDQWNARCGASLIAHDPAHAKLDSRI